MTVEQSGLIDIIAVDESKKVAELIISDHLPWEEESAGHCVRVQEKINEYLGFIEGGTLFEAKPDLCR